MENYCYLILENMRRYAKYRYRLSKWHYSIFGIKVATTRWQRWPPLKTNLITGT